MKDDVTTQRLLSHLRHSLLCSRLSLSERSRLVDSMVPHTARPGEVVVREGDTHTDFFYLVDKGELEVRGKRKNKGGRDECLAVLRAGDTFGEVALWYATPRNATVRARTPCVLWTVERNRFVELLDYKKHQFEPWVKALEKVNLLKSLLPYELTMVAYASSVRRVNAGELLYKEGGAPDSFYIVLSGSVCSILFPSFPYSFLFLSFYLLSLSSNLCSVCGILWSAKRPNLFEAQQHWRRGPGSTRFTLAISESHCILRGPGYQSELFYKAHTPPHQVSPCPPPISPRPLLYPLPVHSLVLYPNPLPPPSFLSLLAC